MSQGFEQALLLSEAERAQSAFLSVPALQQLLKKAPQLANPNASPLCLFQSAV